MRRHKRLRDGFAERLVPQGWPFTPEMQAPPLINAGYRDLSQTGALSVGGYCDIWIQAASGGEAYLAWEILRLLAASGGGLRVLCTTCTRQGLEVLHKAQQELEQASINITVNYLPLDEPPLMRRAVRQVFGPKPQSVAAQAKIESKLIGGGSGQCCASAATGGFARFGAAEQGDTSAFTRGRVLVLLETEIWPGLLAACSQAEVRVLVLNARMTEGSFKAYRFLAPLLRRHSPHGVLATTEGDLERFCRVFDGKFAKSEKVPLEGKYEGRFLAESGKFSAGSDTPPKKVPEFTVFPASSTTCHCSGQAQSDFGHPVPDDSVSGQSGSKQFGLKQSAPELLGAEQFGHAQPASEQCGAGQPVPGRSGRVRGLMHNIKFDRVFMGGEIKKKDPATRPASGVAPYPPGVDAACAASEGRPAQGCGGDLSAGLSVGSSADCVSILSAKNASINSGICKESRLSSESRESGCHGVDNGCASPSSSPLAPLLLASVREEEEEQLLEVLHELRRKRPDLPIVVAPRHMHRVPAWEAALEKATHAECLAGEASAGNPECPDSSKNLNNSKSPDSQKSVDSLDDTASPADIANNPPTSTPSAAAILYSKRSDFADTVSALRLRPGEIRIWDAFGEMDLLYRASCAVFVGGSLAPLGGQNFLEPLGVGLVPVIGPFWSNFYWAGTEIFEQNLARRVENSGQLAAVLLDLAENPRSSPDVIRDFNAYLAPRRGGTRQAVQLIMETMLY